MIPMSYARNLANLTKHADYCKFNFVMKKRRTGVEAKKDYHP